MQYRAERIETREGFISYRQGGGHENLEIVTLNIIEDFKRQGYGTTLVKKVEEIAKELKCASIYLFTRKMNKEARAFYEKLGYREIVEIPSFYRKESGHTGIGIMYIKNI
jgi:ribosomal-protein-alanine N-acetyltransferase